MDEDSQSYIVSQDTLSSTALSEYKEKILLIDLENCPSQINMLLQDLERFSQVVICYAQSGAKIPLDWLMPLTIMVNSQKLKIIKMPSGGKNAADFGICFLAGMLMAQCSSEAHFVIMSDDSDLDHTIKLLKSYGRTAARISLKKEDSTVSSDAVKETTLQGYCQKLLVHHKNRPAAKKGLLNSLLSYYGQNADVAEVTFNKLLQLGVITLNTNDKITYHNSQISQLAKT